MNKLTTCPYCGVGCGVKASIENEQIIAVCGDNDHPANQGRLCVKGSALHETTGAHDRLLHPQVDGQRVSWDEALDSASSRLQQIIAESGPSSVAMYVSGQLLTEDYYVANKLMKGFIGSSHIDTNSRLCMSSTVAGYKRAFGGDLMPCCYEDIDHAELLVLTGSNAAWNHPILYQRMAQAKAANPRVKVVVIDPRHTASSDLADLHLSLRPGSDAVLFNAVLVALQQRQLLDHTFIGQHTEGFDAALEAANQSAPDLATVAAATDLPLADLTLFLDWFCTFDRTLTFFSQGINQSTSGTDKVNAIINCHLASGRIGKPGMGPFSLTGQPNAMGGREVGGLANQLAAHMDFSQTENIDRVSRFWQACNPAQQEGYKAVELFEAIARGEIRALWIMATNPLVSLPDANRVRAALAQCELVIVSECMAQTDTLALADIALPATTWGEKDGTVTNSERRISRQRRLIPAPGQAKPDWWILCEIAKRLGYADAFDYTGPSAIFREHAALSGFENDHRRGFDISALADLNDQQYDLLQPVQWPVNTTNPAGTPRLFSDGHFFTPSGKARFLPIKPRLPAQQPTAEFPFILNTGRIRDQWHTMTRTGRAARLMQHRPEPFIEVHPDDAQSRGINDGTLARLNNAQGEFIARTRYSVEQRRGELFIPMHWNAQFAPCARSGVLLESAVDPISGQPESKHGRSNLTPWPSAWEGRLLCRTALTPSTDYWSRVPLSHCTSYWLAGSQQVQDWDDWCQQNLGETASLWLEDTLQRRYRGCGFKNGQLEWVLLVEPSNSLPDLEWLDLQFSKPNLAPEQRRRLLSAEPEQGVPSGRVICSCFQVREPQIMEAAQQGADTVAALGKQLKCGTNCGSCIPELKALLTETLVI